MNKHIYIYTYERRLEKGFGIQPHMAGRETGTRNQKPNGGLVCQYICSRPIGASGMYEYDRAVRYLLGLFFLNSASCGMFRKLPPRDIMIRDPPGSSLPEFLSQVGSKIYHC